MPMSSKTGRYREAGEMEEEGVLGGASEGWVIRESSAVNEYDTGGEAAPF